MLLRILFPKDESAAIEELGRWNGKRSEESDEKEAELMSPKVSIMPKMRDVTYQLRNC